MVNTVMGTGYWVAMPGLDAETVDTKSVKSEKRKNKPTFLLRGPKILSKYCREDILILATV